MAVLYFEDKKSVFKKADPELVVNVAKELAKNTYSDIKAVLSDIEKVLTLIAPTLNETELDNTFTVPPGGASHKFKPAISIVAEKKKMINLNKPDQILSIDEHEDIPDHYKNKKVKKEKSQTYQSLGSISSSAFNKCVLNDNKTTSQFCEETHSFVLGLEQSLFKKFQASKLMLTDLLKHAKEIGMLVDERVNDGMLIYELYSHNCKKQISKIEDMGQANFAAIIFRFDKKSDKNKLMLNQFKTGKFDFQIDSTISNDEVCADKAIKQFNSILALV
jgi:hypothetical protein